ncbi:MAG: DUF885 domain-containing protein [Gemmatimonadales bacterium]
MAVGSLRELERSYFDVRWHLDPVEATQAGITDHDDRYGRFSPAALRPHLAALKSLSAGLEETAAESTDDEIDRTALVNSVRVTLRQLERERPQAANPDFWLSHLLSGLYVLLVRSERPPADRGRALLARLEDIPAFLDDARDALERPVRVFVETAIPVNEAGIELVREIPAVAAKWLPHEEERLAAAATAAVAALTAFGRDLDRWRDTEYQAFALGEDGFNFRLHYEHALRDTAPELWRYGHHLVEELEADLTRRAARLDGSRVWADVVERLRTDHPTADTLVAEYARQMARARDFVAARGLASIPEAPLEVVPTPAFMRPLIPFAAYDGPGAYSTDRTGLFYVTVPDARLPADQREHLLRDHCRYELPATALHEGYPGHHLHLVHARSQASHTRKNLWTPLTVEGWALYCEDMMGEEGFYASDEERFFQRVDLLWRAMRILLDVGLHTRGMTYEEAVGTFVDRLRVDRSTADAEVRRYCAWPSYQLCYAVGRRELLRLRDDFRARAGSDYTLRRFHDAILPYGGLPVTLIRWGLGLGE